MKNDIKKPKNSETNSERVSKDGTKRGLNPKSKENLKPFVPGVVTNPDGRGKGKRDFNTMVNLAIEALATEFMKQQNMKKENKDKQISLEEVDVEADIFKQFINKARNGDLKAIDSFLDRRHGKAVQPIKVSGDREEPLQIEILERKKKLSAWQSMWFKTDDEIEKDLHHAEKAS